MTLDETNLKCIDLDECQAPGYCENGSCENLEEGLGFECTCNKGFVETVDGKSCEGNVVNFLTDCKLSNLF